MTKNLGVVKRRGKRAQEKDATSEDEKQIRNKSQEPCRSTRADAWQKQKVWRREDDQTKVSEVQKTVLNFQNALKK